MKVSSERLPDAQVLLQIEVDQEQMDRSLERAYRRLVQRVEVPGFRKGKTPRNMLERHLGRGRLLEEAIDILIPEAYSKALEEQDVDAIDQPQIELVNAEPLSFKATVPIRPTVDLGDYQSLRVDREPVAVDEKDVDETVEELRRRHAIQEPVDRRVKLGDIVRGDVTIVVEDREVYKDEDVEFRLRDGATVFLPGFVEGMIGARKGTPHQVKVSVPEGEGDLAGKTGNATVVVKEVKEERLPDADDAFAGEIGEGFESLQALRERLREDIQRQAEQQAEEAYREKALGELTEQAASIEFPPVLVDREVERFVRDQARSTGQDVDAYLKLIRKTPEEIREELTPTATERVKRSLALSQLSEEENIEVVDEDVSAEIERIVESSGQPEQMRSLFASADAGAAIRRSLLTRKTLERLTEIASQENGAKPAKKKARKKAKVAEEAS